MIASILAFLGTNQYILGVASLCGIVSFILTVIVTIRTAKISKILKHNEITSRYNKERTGFQKAFEGHRKSITVDGLRSKQLLTDILKNVEAYRAEFSEILSWHEKVRLTMFIKQLKKKPEQADFNSISNYLASISGRLSKKGDMKNG